MIQGPKSLPGLPVLQWARGCGRIAVRAEAGVTRLSRLYQDGCGKIRLPRDARAEGLEAVLINSSGGLTGGNRMEWAAEVGDGARLTRSTQACEKIYRARDGVAEQRAPALDRMRTKHSNLPRFPRLPLTYMARDWACALVV